MALRLPTGPDDALLLGWYHTIELGEGLVSRGHFDHRPIVNSYGLPDSLVGKRVLDVATGDGFFAFEMERRGADEVVAIDVASLAECDWLPRMRSRVPSNVMESTTWGDHFAIAHSLLGSKVQRLVMSVYDLSPERIGTFDLVFCGDLLLHLQNPLQALVNIRSVTQETAVVETLLDMELEAQFPNRPFVRFGALDFEKEAGELNTYWTVNTRALEDMLRYADFASVERKGVFSLPPHGLPATSIVASSSGPDRP